MSEPQKRIDPPSRPVDGSIISGFRLVNQNPDHDYIKANPNDPDTGVDAMLAQGWKVVRHHKDGPRFIGLQSPTDGDIVTHYGSVLMFRPKELGIAAQEHVRRIASARWEAMGRPGGVDNVRGDNGSLAKVSIKA